MTCPAGRLSYRMRGARGVLGRVAVSLRCVAHPLAIRCSFVQTLYPRASVCSWPSLQQARDPALRFPLRGPSARFPRFFGTFRALRLPNALPPRSFASLGSTTPPPRHLRSRKRPGAAPAGLALVRRGAPPAFLLVGAAVTPPQERRLPQGGLFRGSISRPASLAVYPSQSESLRTTQDSLLGWWPPFAGRDSHPPGPSQKVSQWLPHCSSSPSLTLAQAAQAPVH